MRFIPKSNTIDLITIILFLSVIAVLVFLGAYQAVNLFVILMSVLLLFENRRALLLIYLMLLPTNGFISTEYNLFGILHVSYIVNTFATLSIMYEWILSQKKTKTNKIRLTNVHKYIIWFILFLLLYPIFTDIRLFIFDIPIEQEEAYRVFITRPIRALVMFFPLIIISREYLLKQKIYLIHRGYLYSLVLISIGIIFAGSLSQIGFYTRVEFTSLDYLFSDSLTRSSGFFTGLGDVNTAAGYLTIGIAYLLFFSNLKSINKIFFTLFICIGVVFTGSRTGFMNLIIVFICFFLTTNISLRQKYLYGVGICIAGIGIINLGVIDQITERFEELTSGESVHLDAGQIGGRLGGWFLYLRYIFSDINITLLGTTENMYDTYVSYSYDRAAHNFYLTLWYYWGLFAVLYFISKLTLFLITASKLPFRIGLIAIYIPLTITLFFVSDIGVILSFIMCLIIVSYQPKLYG